MTEANLQTLWPSYQSQEQVYCLHSSARSVHNSRKKKQLYTYTYIATLGATFVGPRAPQGMYTIRGKPAVQLPR